MGNTISADIFTQEELQKYFNILNPVICPTHNKPAKVYYEDGMLKLEKCCDELISHVRLQIAEQISKTNPE